MKSILVVEDDPHSRYMMTEMLCDLGFSFLEASDGEMALAMSIERAGEIEMILMDVHMPVKSGPEAVREIRRLKTNPPRDLPIIAVTADPIWQNRETARLAGFSNALSKPVSMATLRAAIELHLI